MMVLISLVIYLVVNWDCRRKFRDFREKNEIYWYFFGKFLGHFRGFFIWEYAVLYF